MSLSSPEGLLIRLGHGSTPAGFPLGSRLLEHEPPGWQCRRVRAAPQGIAVRFLLRDSIGDSGFGYVLFGRAM